MHRGYSILVSERLRILNPNELLLTFADFKDFDHKLLGHKDVLNSEEENRMRAFVHESDRQRYGICHSLLRLQLCQLTGIPARDITFGRGEYGKPFVSNMGLKDLQFNISHSAKHMLYGFCWNQQIGVDVEEIKQDFACEEIVLRFFSGPEINEYYDQPLYKRQEYFYSIWCRKESVIKALGVGLSMPLNTFSVSPNNAKVLCSIAFPASAPPKKFATESIFDQGEGFRAAVSYEISDSMLSEMVLSFRDI